MNHLFGLGFFNLEDICGRNQFDLIFNKVCKFGVLRQNFYREFFDKIKFNNDLIEENYRNRYMVEFGNDVNMKFFVKDKDFTRINWFVLRNVASGRYLKLYDDSYPSENFPTFYFSAIPPNRTPNLDSHLIKILATNGLRISYKSNHLRENESSLVIKKIIVDILTRNPMLECENAPFDTRELLYIQVTNRLFELRLLNSGSICGVENSRERCYILNSIDCSRCGVVLVDSPGAL
uniref:Uncharacterized protein n=1 Tax=Strongyloides venezuelensis TaxID=75913 RepID=A0A0K0G007_STRVS